MPSVARLHLQLVCVAGDTHLIIDVQERRRVIVAYLRVVKIDVGAARDPFGIVDRINAVTVATINLSPIGRPE